ncbi:hypothetical protein BEP19_05930 [Ammoniphilus oxalaticus]|uniref:Uncharacterized protein n=1 Tax=Ammoniphilus oxalaticus TaxID=66863 RepID=A0A419SJ65_9BACL|nr:hypothetical protein [Ammoniphilus oxalaticus]RKD23958.1 hypothetical protein BEP19_05930 [Ammoniphilus oxalaticus]
MSMQEVVEKNYEEPVKQVAQPKKDKVVQQKLGSVIFIWVSFVALYFAVSSGNETMMWGGLGLTVLASAMLYLRN